MNIVKQLKAIEEQVKKLQTENARYKTQLGALSADWKFNLYRMRLDDCEISIEEYALGTSLEEVKERLGWPWDTECKDMKIEQVMNAEHLSQLLQLLYVRTVDEDFD